MEQEIKEYSNGEVTVVWNPNKCIHSAICVKGLNSVFNSRARPWINMEGANSEAIIKQVAQCPSGALSIKNIPVMKTEDKPAQNLAEVVIIKNGPVMVKGQMTIKHKDGREEAQQEIYLCRCGQSSNKPFCDGSHKKCGFKDE